MMMMMMMMIHIHISVPEQTCNEIRNLCRKLESAGYKRNTK